MNNRIYKKAGTGSQTLEILDNAEKYNQWLASMFRPFLGKKNAEIGAGQGTISEYVLKDNKVFLSDIAPYNVKVLKQRFSKNRNILGVDAKLNKKAFRNSFDCIYSSNVLEHIENDEEFIGDCLTLLKKKGYFVAVVPAMHQLYSEFDRSIGHFRRYSVRDKKRIEYYITEQFPGSKIECFRFFNQIGMFGWFLKMKLLGQKDVRKEDVKVLQLVLPINKILNRLNLPFGQSVLLVIRK